MNAERALQLPATRLGSALARLSHALADLMARWRRAGSTADHSAIVGTQLMESIAEDVAERPTQTLGGTRDDDRDATGETHGPERSSAPPSASPAQTRSEAKANANAKPKPLAAWRIAALDRIRELHLATREIEETAPEDIVSAIRSTLDSASAVASSAPMIRRRFATAWRGSDLERVWLAIHRAEVLLVEWTEDRVENVAVLDDIRERATQRLKPRDVRLVALDGATDAFPDERSDTLRAGSMKRGAMALRASFAVSAEQHRQVRDFRNVLIITSVTVMAVAVVVAFGGWIAPNAINLCWPIGTGPEPAYCPSGGSAPSWGDVAVVEMFGIVGAAVVGAIGIRHLRGSAVPYSVPLWSILVKLPIGALTAVLALLLLQLVDSFTISSQQEIAAWAVIFGVSQEAFTRLIDRQAQVVLDRIPTSDKNDVATPGRDGPIPSPAP